MNGLDDLKGGYELTKEIVKDIQNIKKAKVATLESDLTALINELSKSFETIVGFVHPIRSLPNEPQEFETAFGDYYIDFKKYYDSEWFNEERTRCHKIGLIHSRITPKISRILNKEKAEKFDNMFSYLSDRDYEFIDDMETWLNNVNSEMDNIHLLVDSKKVKEAINAKNEFISNLGVRYNELKSTLKDMNKTTAKIRQSY